MLRQGYVVVGTDYPGLGVPGIIHPYLIGVSEARAVIDSVRAARDLLLRAHPRSGQGAGEELRRPGESAVDAARRLVLSLDRSTLPIQGPPGSGKTYTGARMILDLVARGARVGVVSAWSGRCVRSLAAPWARKDSTNTPVRNRSSASLARASALASSSFNSPS